MDEVVAERFDFYVEPKVFWPEKEGWVFDRGKFAKGDGVRGEGRSDEGVSVSKSLEV